MPLTVAIALMRNKHGPTAWASEEWSIGPDEPLRRWCTVGIQTDAHSRQTLGSGQTFEAAFSAADARGGRLPQRRSVR